MFEARTYRKTHNNAQLDHFEVSFLETDLWIGIDKGKYFEDEVIKFALDKIKELRALLVGYNTSHHQFITSYEPLNFDQNAPNVIQKMLDAGIKTNTGPMTSVAGIFAEYIGKSLKNEFRLENIIVENGGDNYLSLNSLTATIPIHTGNDNQGNKIGLKIKPEETPIGICTSSGKIGHSISFGKADTVTVVSKNIAAADAFATSICNQVKTKYDLDDLITKYGHNDDIESLIIIMDGNVGLIGEHEVVFLK
jgi:uncharacterized protein